MQAPKWKDIEAVPTRYKTAYDRACEAANQKAQKIQESADAPTWLKNDYDRAAQAALQGIFGCKCCGQKAALQAELDQKSTKIGTTRSGGRKVPHPGPEGSRRVP